MVAYVLDIGDIVPLAPFNIILWSLLPEVIVPRFGTNDEDFIEYYSPPPAKWMKSKKTT